MGAITKQYTFTNGTIANGTQVNKNFDDLYTLVNGNLDANNIKDGAAIAAKLATDSVETVKIKDANVTAAKLATDSVETVKIKDGAVTTDKILNGAVTPAKLATDSVETVKIKDANVTAAKLASDINTKVLLGGDDYGLTDGSTIAIDWSNGATQSVTLGATGRTVTFANPVAGQVYRLIIKQDATGSRTITTWPTIKWAGGTAPTLTTTASKADIVTLLYDGASYYASATLNF